MMKMVRKSPARASSMYPTPFMLLDLKTQAYAWLIIVYSKQDILQDISGKLFDNSGHTLYSIF